MVRTTHADADLVASALAPDDTDSMAVRVDGDAIDCRIERPTTGGLRSTVDDYVVNLRVADRVIERAREHRTVDGTTADETTGDGTAADGADARETNIRETDTRDADADTDTRHNP
ncbi:KEOPS complex Pcc1-like subunit [Halorubrum sp. 48-1-W]|nr:KEOPS complex subunit Pcc1 [Halorubrum sp. 48-1-W]RAW45237.1 KEOPS complex Pcc1-like subunit [Halorubrum sp. 48-1-W]